MKNRKTIIYAILAVIVVYLVRLYLAALRLGFSIGSIRSVSLKGGVLSWKQGVVVVNPSATNIPVNAADIDLYINNQKLGSAILSEAIVFTGRDKAEMMLYCQIPYLELLSLLGGLIDTILTKKFAIGFKGRVWAANLPIQLNENYNYSLSMFGIK